MWQFRRFVNKYRVFILPISVIVGGCLLFVFILLPAIQQTIDLFNNVKDVQETVGKMQQKLTVLNGLDETSLLEQFTVATSAVPSEISLPTILRTIEGVSDKTGVTVKALSVDSAGNLATQSAKQFSTDEKKIGAYSIPFSVTLTGTFDQLKDFLSQSNKALRLVRAKSFTLNFSDQNTLTTQMSFDTFFLPGKDISDVDILTQLKRADSEMLQAISQFPNYTQVNVSTPLSPSSGGGKPNPFSL